MNLPLSRDPSNLTAATSADSAVRQFSPPPEPELLSGRPLEAPVEVAKVPFSVGGYLKKEIVDYDPNGVAGLDKCAKCGASEADYDIVKRVLTCRSCRNENPGEEAGKRFGKRDSIKSLEGYIATSSISSAISENVIVTIKCQGCGAEVAVNTFETLAEKCHWCRQLLSLNHRVPNGAAPDGILPFTITRDEAMARVAEFVKGRWFFALNRFKQEFKPENVYPVYLPYGIADARFKGELWGEAEKHIREYRSNKTTKYDFDVYNIYRSYSMLANDVPIEAAGNRRIDIHRNTNNVLQAVQPFPIEHALSFKAQYLSGFRSERRDLDPASLDHAIHNQLLTVLRGQGSRNMTQYQKRGVRWENEQVDVVGLHLASIYLPIWLYAFVEKNVRLRGESHPADLIHYIAVNGNTGKVMGSIPVNKPKLTFFSVVLGCLVGFPASFLVLGYLMS